jgi:hypothetical protein
VSIGYEIEGQVVVLSVAVDGFPLLRDALEAAAADPRARPKMPVLLDVRNEPVRVHYDDVRWRTLILSQARQHFGPRWAVLSGPGPVPLAVGRMFAALSEIEGLEVGLFVDREGAILWLTGAWSARQRALTTPPLGLGRKPSPY